MNKFLENKKKFFPLLGLLLIFGILTFWKISKLQYFSYDQARDFLIIKNILLNQKLTLIGPSLGITDGAYLPPLYYYLISPFLFLSRFHLWGPDLLSILAGLGGVVVFYLLARSLFGAGAAFLAGLFYVLNPFMVQASRHIRNPHLLPVFLLLFAYCSKLFLENKKDKYFLFATVFFGITLSLHITAVVFLPVFLFLLLKQINKKAFISILLSVLILFLFFSPLLFFDLRHNFGISRAVGNFFSNGSEGNLSEKILRFFIFIIEVPTVLFSGIFQKELLSLRSFPILPLEKINFFGMSIFELIKAYLSLLILGFCLVFGILGIKDKRRKVSQNFRFVLIFVFLGFLVSFFLPPDYSYLYYFYNLFPFLFLLLAGGFSLLPKEHKSLIPVLAVLLAVMPLLPTGLKTETRPEEYFLPAVELISLDVLPGDLPVVAANLADNTRWEKNGLEYRYFLESMFHIPLLGDGEDDYRKANVLYLIDEGSLVSPLSLGGMEMETFGPKKIEKVWKVETGQKIYKLTK